MINDGQLDFKLGITEEEITSRAGLAVFFEFLVGFGIKELMEGHMPSPGSNRGYGAWSYMGPLMLMLYGGGRHMEDLREIREDRGLRRLLGYKAMPSTSTVGDWLRRMGAGEGLAGLRRVMAASATKALRMDKREEYTLWSDPTLIEAEKADAKMSYEGYRGYRPIVTMLRELPVVVHHEFRDGNAMGGTKEAVEAAYGVLPAGKRIRHASLDSEFYTAEVIDLFMGKGTPFTIAVSKDEAVKEAIRGLEGWKAFKGADGISTDREIAETVHTMNGTREAFRLVVLRWRKSQPDLFEAEGGYCYHAIATNLECSAEEVVWEYNLRGQAENIIKELKGGFGMEDMPSGDFGANAFWFALGVLTYNMFVLQKEHLLPGHWRTRTIGTLRWSLIGIAGKVVRHGRRVWLKLAASREKLRLYHRMRMRMRCMALG